MQRKVKAAQEGENVMEHQFEYSEKTVAATDKGKIKGYASRGLLKFIYK